MSTRAMASPRVAAFVLLALLPLAAASCGGRPLDEGDLRAVAAHYYAAGNPVSLPAERCYRFLSDRSKASTSPARYAAEFGGQIRNAVRSVEVLGERLHGGRRYAVVSVTREVEGRGRSKARCVTSATWVNEGGKWRRVIFPELDARANRALDAGDLVLARRLVTEWLDLDPFSVDARILAACASGVPPGDPSLRPIVRKLMSINPDDTEALHCAATCLASRPESFRYLERLRGTDRYADTARNLLELIERPEELFDAVTEIGIDGTPA